jgi:hypothetical protein
MVLVMFIRAYFSSEHMLFPSSLYAHHSLYRLWSGSLEGKKCKRKKSFKKSKKKVERKKYEETKGKERQHGNQPCDLCF